MLAKTASVTLVGTEAHIVEVEIHVGTGLPGFAIVGLPAKSVREAEHRTHAALDKEFEKAEDSRWPKQRVVANLAPGRLPKEGTQFDLALAVGILAATKKLDANRLEDWVVIGELALDASVRPVRGALPAAISCKRSGRKGLVCPAGNAVEAALVKGLSVVPVSTLAEAERFFAGGWRPETVPSPTVEEPQYPEDLSEVRGHPHAKRALEIAAAGGHNLLEFRLDTPV